MLHPGFGIFYPGDDVSIISPQGKFFYFHLFQNGFLKMCFTFLPFVYILSCLDSTHAIAYEHDLVVNFSVIHVGVHIYRQTTVKYKKLKPSGRVREDVLHVFPLGRRKRKNDKFVCNSCTLPLFEPLCNKPWPWLVPTFFFMWRVPSPNVLITVRLSDTRESNHD